MLNPLEEEKFTELKDKCRELKVPAPPEIMIGLKVHNKNGVLIFDDIQRGHSWTRNFWNFMYCSLACAKASDTTFAAGKLSGKNTAGTVDKHATMLARHSGSDLAELVGYKTNLASDVAGIIVGTGDTAFSVGQYVLATPIAHGNGAGQLSYNIMAVPTVTYSGDTKTWTNTVVRIFNNNSGGSITVKETALYAQAYLPYSARYNMFERSVLDPTVAVANGAQLTVTYEISMDFSAID